MEGAISFEITSGFLKLYILGYDIYDIKFLFYFVYNVHRLLSMRNE